MTDVIKDFLVKSAQSIDAASLLLSDRYVDFAASRAYYVIYRILIRIDSMLSNIIDSSTWCRSAASVSSGISSGLRTAMKGIPQNHFSTLLGGVCWVVTASWTSYG